LRRHHIIRIAAALAFAGAAVVPSMAMGQRNLALASSTVPPYQHIFVIMEENHSYDQIIDNPTTAIAAQNLNTYAKMYGLATN
jgi:phospholipase C